MLNTRNREQGMREVVSSEGRGDGVSSEGGEVIDSERGGE